MRAVVTGCAGFIGSHLTERLLGEGWRVLGIDSFEPTYDSGWRRAFVGQLATRSGFEFVEGDMRDMDLAPLVGDVDVVFHLAARAGVRASWEAFGPAAGSNILATQRLLDAMTRTGSGRLVFASSSSVYGSVARFPTLETDPLLPISPYGVTKMAGEALVAAYCSQSSLVAASLRYFTVYGPRQRSDMAFTRWIRAALEGRPLPVFGDGSAIRDFTYVEDVVDATVAVATCELVGHEAFNVAGGSPVSILEVIEEIRRLVGLPIELDHGPRPMGDPPRTGGDTSKLRAFIEWEPASTLADGLARQVEWARTRFG